MSRFVTLLALSVLATAPVDAADPLSTYTALTQAAVRGCSRPTDSREIVVCARRADDRYRAPLQAYVAGDPRGEGVLAERNRLASEPRQPCGTGAFLACQGMVGVTLTLHINGTPLTVRTPVD